MMPVGATAQKEGQPVIRVRYVLYARKSTESEERQILSIDSQIKEMLELAEKEALEIAEIRRESHSAKNAGERPVFNEIINDIRLGKFNGILTWSPDRLSRSAGDLGAIVDLIDQKLLREIRTYSQKFTDSPNEKFLLMILGSQAKLENDNRGVNVKRGMKTRCEMGLRPGVAPVGYLNEKRSDRKCYVMFDPVRAPIIKKMFELVGNERWSGRKIYHWLKFELNFKAKSNKTMALSSIFLTLQNPFYYGVFEYPVKSGNWYTGKHEPLITKELYEKVQEHLKRDQITHGESREFAFTRLMTCGLCGSGITAAERLKKLATGEVASYIYYWCSRSKDKYCKSGCLREEDLVNQLIPLIHELDLDENGIRKKFEAEVARLNKFQKSFMGGNDERMAAKGVDIKDYARYVLKDGSMTERREFMSCITSKITVTKKVVAIQREEVKRK
jgi:DNA invertase Pin-like site-specific DNA recombinase